METMTLAPAAPTRARRATPDHPRFVGLALLRSLLAHEEVCAHSRRSDAVLDLIALLLRDAPAASVVRAFCHLRQHCGPVCYLAIFRFRRWLEAQIVVGTAKSPWQPVSLAFHEHRLIEQHYRRLVWEAAPDICDWDSLPVHFAWTLPDRMPLAPGDARAAQVLA
jgi:hypothetical protein